MYFQAAPAGQIARSIKGLAAVCRKARVTNHAKSLDGTGLRATLRQTKHCPAGALETLAYSLAALAIAGGAALVRNAGAPTLLLAGGDAPPRATAALFDSTKSAMRGTISARKREPLNTP